MCMFVYIHTIKLSSPLVASKFSRQVQILPCLPSFPSIPPRELSKQPPGGHLEQYSCQTLGHIFSHYSPWNLQDKNAKPSSSHWSLILALKNVSFAFLSTAPSSCLLFSLTSFLHCLWPFLSLFPFSNCAETLLGLLFILFSSQVIYEFLASVITFLWVIPGFFPKVLRFLPSSCSWALQA